MVAIRVTQRELARILRGMTSLNSLSLSMGYSSNYHSYGLYNI